MESYVYQLSGNCLGVPFLYRTDCAFYMLIGNRPPGNHSDLRFIYLSARNRCAQQTALIMSRNLWILLLQQLRVESTGARKEMGQR